MCGAECDDGSPCQRRVSDGGRCYLHSNRQPPDHGPPAENINAVTHGLHLSPERRIAWFDDQQLEWFKEYRRKYAKKAENDAEATRLASLAVVADLLERELIKNGFVRSRVDPREEGGIQTIEAYTYALSELRRGLRSEGVTGGDRDG